MIKSIVMLYKLRLKALLFTIIFVVVACHNSKIQNPILTVNVAPPINDMQVKFKTYSINNCESKTIREKNGTTIVLPDSAFEDKHGNIVTKKVKIDYREFHTAAEVISSGIPMYTIDEEGDMQYFQTAGMFEIRAKSDGEEVFLRDGMTVEVSMASFYPGDDYTFYELDTESPSVWLEKGISAPVVNQNKVNSEELVAKPLKPIKYNHVTDLVLDIDVNYNKFPELKAFKGVMWKYAGDREQKKINQIFSKSWNSASLEQLSEFEYQIILSDNKNLKETIKVEPVLTGKNYEKALISYQKKMLAYEEDKRQIEQKKKEADIQRVFAIKNMGIYNWDRYYKINIDPQKIDFTAPDLNFASTKEYPIYLISGPLQNVVIKYIGPKCDRFFFNSEEENTIIGILPNNTLGVISSTDFQKQLEEKQIATDKPYREFTFSINDSISCINDLDKILSNL